MHLIISSTSLVDARIIFLDGKKKWEKRIAAKNGQRGDVLGAIDALLASKKKTASQLMGVVVVAGPGQFSHLRTGISIANAFGWALGIPVIGINLDQFSSDEELVAKSLAMLKKKKKFSPIMPVYGKEPNITKVQRLEG